GSGEPGFAASSPLPALRSLLSALSALPYENLSKIVARHEGGATGKTREGILSFPASWLEDHARTGLGGTCFALTHWLKLRLDARAWLLDLGYLIFEPIPLPQGGLTVELFLSPNVVRVEDVPDAGVWRLWTGPRGNPGGLKHRFDFRKEPVSADEFQRHWEAS